MRLMNWNIEHMNSWWTSDNPPVMRASYAGGGIAPAISDVTDLANRVANVIRAVDPDVITIQEGAGQPELEQFFNGIVDTSGNQVWTIHSGGSAQALAVAVRTDRGVITSVAAGPDIVANYSRHEVTVALSHGQFVNPRFAAPDVRICG